MIPDEKNLTPMMKQYLQVKSEAPKDSILLFRLGDFMKCFTMTRGGPARFWKSC